jgi:hypothetical protein
MRTVVRRGAAALLIAVSAFGVGATPTLADTTTPYVATFPREVTTLLLRCPAGVPAGAVCFTGQDHSGLGRSLPGGGVGAREDFAGYVDVGHPIPRACLDGSDGFPDHNVVSITTSEGRLFATTDGTACGFGQPTTTDVGTWRAIGGTGKFAGARGGGSVSTVGTPVSTTQINSSSRYTGTLTLR